MSKPTRLFLNVALFVSACAIAFPQRAAEPAIAAEMVIVEETRLMADAAGTTRIRIDESVPSTGRSWESLAGRVANLHANTGGARSFGDIFTLRGLSNTPFFSDPAVTVYYDDIPLASSFSYPTGLFGFNDIAVHRGPQATSFGRAGAGGVIVFSSSEPASAASGEVRVSGGNYQARAGALNVRSARSEGADAAVAFAYQQRDGYIQNTQLGIRVDDQEAYTGSARVRVRPAAGSEFTLQVLGSRTRDGAQPLVPLGGPYFRVARGREGSTATDNFGAALKGSFDTAVGQLTSTTSYTDWRLDPYDNRMVLPPALDSRIIQTQRTWNEELRLASAHSASASWSLGAWFSDGKTTGDVNRAIPGLFPIEISSYRIESRTLALFGETEFAPTAALRVRLGLRAEVNDKDFSRREVVPAVGAFSGDDRFKSLLPKITVSYALREDLNFSASVSQGSKPGGYSAFTSSATLAPFRAEKTTAFEAGIDGVSHDKTVRFAARIFAYHIRDYQIERSFTFTDYLVVNAPRARSLGGEIEATWRPAPEWTFAATLGVTDVTLRRFTDPFTGESFAGKRAPYAPEYDGHLNAVYRAPAGWFVGGELAVAGRTFYDEAETAGFSQSSRTTVNARAGYDTERWRISFFGENLTDEEYYSLIIPGVGHGTPGGPKTYGVEAVVKF